MSDFQLEKFMIPFDVSEDEIRKYLTKQGVTYIPRAEDFQKLYIPNYYLKQDVQAFYVTTGLPSETVRCTCEGLVAGVSHLPEKELVNVHPYKLADKVPYDAEQLVGCYEEAIDMSLEALREKTAKEILDYCKLHLYIPRNTHQTTYVEPNYNADDLAEALVLLPLYIVTLKAKDKPEKVYVNGQSGRIIGLGKVTGGFLGGLKEKFKLRKEDKSRKYQPLNLYIKDPKEYDYTFPGI